MDVPGGPQLGSEELRFTPEQRRIVEALLELGAAEPAQLYLGALLILSRPDFPGAVYLVGHACREIYNRLPCWLDMPIPRRVEYANTLDGILPLWKRMGSAVGAQAETINIPAVLYGKLDELIRQHEDSRLLKGRERRTAVFWALGKPHARNDGDSTEADLESWLRLGDGLEAIAHLRAKGKQAPPLERARGALLRLERLLWRRLVQPAFYEGVEVLDEILREANR